MTFNPALIDGPIPIAIYGDPITDDEGHTYRPITGYVEGYHLNISLDIMTPELQPYAQSPRNPRRVFAGGNTAFLVFADEAEARAMLADYWTDAE